MNTTSTSTNRNNSSLSRRNKSNNLIKSSSATNIHESVNKNYLPKISSFKSKTRNKNEKSFLKSNSTEYNNSNIKYSFNYSFHITNIGEKNKNIVKINNNKFIKHFFQRKKKINENAKIKQNNSKLNLNKTFFSQNLNKFTNKKFIFKVPEIGRNKFITMKKTMTKVNSVRQPLKFNKNKSKSNLEFENELHKQLNNSILKKISRCSSTKFNNKIKNKIKENEKINIENLNISESNSINNLQKLEKKYNLNITNSSLNYNGIMNEFILEKDIEGPEHIHLLLVDLIQKGRKKMNELSSKFDENN